MVRFVAICCDDPRFCIIAHAVFLLRVFAFYAPHAYTIYISSRASADDALRRLEAALEEGSLGECLLNIHELQLPRVLQHAAPLYLSMLQARRQAKGAPLTAEEVAEIVNGSFASRTIMLVRRFVKLSFQLQMLQRRLKSPS